MSVVLSCDAEPFAVTVQDTKRVPTLIRTRLYLREFLVFVSILLGAPVPLPESGNVLSPLRSEVVTERETPTLTPPKFITHAG
jgi:hypothetical protein